MFCHLYVDENDHSSMKMKPLGYTVLQYKYMYTKIHASMCSGSGVNKKKI